MSTAMITAMITAVSHHSFKIKYHYAHPLNIIAKHYVVTTSTLPSHAVPFGVGEVQSMRMVCAYVCMWREGYKRLQKARITRRGRVTRRERVTRKGKGYEGKKWEGRKVGGS